jgi:UDP-N-acetylglucosamine 1-carboxyvinyltransferase
MEKFVIEGGTPLSGTIVPAGNKNGALPILAACMLTSEELVIGNVPRIRDVEAMLSVLEGLGVAISWVGDHEISLCAADVDPHAEIDRRRAEAIRASFLLAGPLLARFGRAVMPPPGADGSTRTSTGSPRSARASATSATSSSRRPRAVCAPARSSWTSLR